MKHSSIKMIFVLLLTQLFVLSCKKTPTPSSTGLQSSLKATTDAEEGNENIYMSLISIAYDRGDRENGKIGDGGEPVREALEFKLKLFFCEKKSRESDNCKEIAATAQTDSISSIDGGEFISTSVNRATGNIVPKREVYLNRLISVEELNNYFGGLAEGNSGYLSFRLMEIDPLPKNDDLLAKLDFNSVDELINEMQRKGSNDYFYLEYAGDDDCVRAEKNPCSLITAMKLDFNYWDIDAN